MAFVWTDVPNYGKRNTLPAKDRLFINDNFDMLIEGAAPEGWSITSNGGTVEIVDVSDSDNKSLKLNKTDDALGTKVDINKRWVR